MRKIVAGLFTALDGVVESPEQWTGPYFCPEIGAEIATQSAASDTMLLGRTTYETFAASFAGQSGGMADQMNNTPKVVVSTTLRSADWQNSTLLTGDIASGLAALKQRDGKNIYISGSPTLVRSLLADGLLDELQLMVFPVVVGTGKRLFDGVGSQQNLTLAESDTFSSGVVKLVYRPAPS